MHFFPHQETNEELYMLTIACQGSSERKDNHGNKIYVYLQGGITFAN